MPFYIPTERFIQSKSMNLLMLFIIFFTSAIFAQQSGDTMMEQINKAAEDYFNQQRINGAQNNTPPSPQAIQEKFFTGAASLDNFGYSVSTAGDVNGDGYDDVIVGAYQNDAGASNAGRAYIYYGGLVFNTIADVVLTGVAASDFFGYSVSAAGDVNGDGYSDVIVGANLYDAGGAGGLDAGRAYIYFGGAIMDNTADITLTGAAADDRFGQSVSLAGDVNSDGYSDVIVGAHFNDAGGSNAGRAYIYFGGTVMNNVADVTLTGAAASDFFGYLVSDAGDVNGDGYSDAIVGAYGNDAGGLDAGRAYIYFGGSAMDNLADVTLTGFTANDRFGNSVSNAGDLNGDGYSDIIVGAELNDAAGTDAGRAYIYFGGSLMNNAVDVIFTGAAASDYFGTSVSCAGDVNGDGFGDVIIGAFGNDAGGSEAGRAYIYYGGSSMDNIADVIMSGAAAFDNFGRSVSNAGDVDGDGYSDVIIGALYNDAGGTNAGRAYLYTNSLTGTDIPDEFFTGAAVSDVFGYSVSTAGDVNGDGYSDVIVGAEYNDAGGSDAGRAYIYFGGPGMDNIADVTLTGAAAVDEFGSSVSTAGDVNGDGYSDVIVGAIGNDAGGSNSGRAYIYFGGSSMNNIADITLTGAAAGDAFGKSVSSAGDVNGDGYADVIAGAIFNDAGGTSAGQAYIYFGGASMNNTADITLTGAAAGDQFGSSVSTAGDVNGDGYADVIAGAIFNDAGGTSAGQAYIYFGGSSMDNTADVTLTGAAADDRFGNSVSTAGDVNGDGYSDVIVGAHLNDAGGSSAGSAYLYFGGSSMNNTADVTLTGATTDDLFGNSVSTAGDVNGDGFSDVIVGAFGNDAGGSGAGRAYTYFGGAIMDNTEDITLTGAAANDYFGYSVSGAGDVNGDGYYDVIVGAYLNDTGGSNAGRAYLYLSSSPPIKPRIMSVKDIPGDQGGFLDLNFVRSGYDSKGINKITEYIIERSNPPGVGGYFWNQIGTVNPLQNPKYGFTAATPSDSSTGTNGAFFFRVTATTSNPDEYWRSNIISAHSVDNLSPAAPLALYAQLDVGGVKLGWQANSEPDFRDYYIYRSETPLSPALNGNTSSSSKAGDEIGSPASFTLIGTTEDTTFIDTSPLSGEAFYYVQAYDVHNNGSPYSVDNIEAILSANLKIFLQGPYSGGQMNTTLRDNNHIVLNQPYNTAPWSYPGSESVASIPANVVDWVLVELRSDINTLSARRAAFLKNDGTLVDLNGTSYINFPSAPAGDYYIVISHRNHLPVMTASKITLAILPTLYDMQTDVNSAYGTNALKALGGIYFGIYSGDTDGSGTVNAGDRSNTWNQRNLSGYYGTDLDLSGTVNAADRSTAWNNRNITTQLPPLVLKSITKELKGENENE